MNELVQRRLIQLGMKEEAEICVQRKLPFGGPFMFESGGQCLGIRLEEAKRSGLKNYEQPADCPFRKSEYGEDVIV